MSAFGNIVGLGNKVANFYSIMGCNGADRVVIIIDLNIMFRKKI